MMKYSDEILVTNFNKEDIKNWNCVNDGVMGGLSESQISYLDGKMAVFSGIVSLENNGGFASSRMKLESGKLAGGKTVCIRLKGDGKKYKFRIRLDDQWDGITYSADFLSKKDEWMEIELPFHEFKPTYRGRILDQTGPLNPAKIQQVGLLISDNQSGSFSITMDWIKCY
jgi:NADH dehydrogenase [ubiquinone] 1 alpha subcomplex assembly factor 1